MKVDIVKKYEGSVMSAGGDHWVEMEESASGEYVALADYEKLKADLYAANVSATHWQTIGNNALSAQRHLEIENNTLKAEREQLLAQEPVGWFIDIEHHGFTRNRPYSEFADEFADSITPLYAKAVPAQQVDINKIKADAVMGFVGTITGAYSSNFVSTPILNIAQLFQVARNSVKDEFGLDTKTLAQEFGEDFAKMCNQRPSPAVAVPELIVEALRQAVMVVAYRAGDMSTEDGTYATTDADSMIRLESALCEALGTKYDDIDLAEALDLLGKLSPSPESVGG